MKRKSALAVAMLALATTQTGCIVGFVLGPYGMPFWAAGTATGIVGSALTLGGVLGGSQGLASFGASLFLTGVILDEENPGRVDHLNMIPLSKKVASEMGVSVNDIKNYNSNLRGAVRDASNQLVGDLKGPVSRIQKSLKSFGKYDLAKDDQVVALAHDYGFADVAELVKVASGRKLPSDKLSGFANRLRLSEQDTRILLYTGLGIVAE